MNEDEWDSFLQCLHEPLPVTFRINTTNKENARIIQAKMLHYQSELSRLESEGHKVTVPKLIPWYPGETGWVIMTSKTELKKEPLMNEIKQFVQVQHDNGGITRQEAVSMLPPLFMGVTESHAVLDMCAAPGSKTGQLLEALFENTTKPTGFVVANDNDQKRAYLLCHTLSRLGNLVINSMVTYHDATMYPTLKVDDESFQFDRILCDVMCSGDGTLRKSPDLWKRWKPTLGYSLHKMQIQVAIRAANLLKTGGRMVYSTCSMNPIEDEASLAEILRRSKGALKLVDCSKHLKNFKYRPGKTDWVLWDKDCKTIISPEDAKKQGGYIENSMFPPTKEEAQEMNLHFGMRILPHDMDTGGFFVALFEKVGDMPNEQSKNKREKNKVQLGKGYHQENYYPLDDKLVASLTEFFGFKDFEVRNLVSKAENDVEPKKIFVSSSQLSKLTRENMQQQKWKIISMGIRLFEFTNGEYACHYRISQEAISWFLPHMNPDRVVVIEKDDFLQLLSKVWAKPGDFTDTRVTDQIEKMTSGPCVTVCKGTQAAISCMKQKFVLHIFAKEDEIKALRELVNQK
jgi:16S rRNA C967 or C1407 C5-methylase (RsmB/RsmF family)